MNHPTRRRLNWRTLIDGNEIPLAILTLAVFTALAVTFAVWMLLG